MDKKEEVTYRDANTWDILSITHMWVKMMDEVDTPELKMLQVDTEKERFFYSLARRIYISTTEDVKEPKVYKNIVAVYRGMPCGFILGDIRTLEYSAHWTGHCEVLYVKKELRNKHIGPELINQLCKWFKTKGVKREQFITLYIPSLAAAWLKRGYKPVQVIYRKEI